MIKTATDYTHTNNPRCLYAAAMAQPFPEFVQPDGVPTSEEMSKLASQAFGDRESRLLPLHTPTAAFYSAIDYFSRPHEFSDEVYEHIKSACHVHGIAEHVPDYAAVFLEGFEKQASTKPEMLNDFALDFAVGDKVVQLLPVNNVYEIEEAALDLSKMASENRIPVVLIASAASAIVKAANAHNVPGEDLRSFVVAHGTERFPDLEKAATLIHSRKGFLNGDDISMYEELIKSAQAGEVSLDDCITKMASMDKENGVSYDYTNPAYGVITPHQVVYCGVSKSAAVQDAQENVLLGDVAVPLSVWNSMSAPVVDMVLEKAAAEEVCSYIGATDAIPVSVAMAGLSSEDTRSVLQILIDTE